MEKAKSLMIALLEKYWQAETSVEEERALAEWFKSQPPGSLDPDLEPYSSLFAYFEEESGVSPGPDLETRILQAIAGAIPAPPPGEPTVPAPLPGKPAGLVRSFRRGLSAAAAAVLILIGGLFLFQPGKPSVDANTAGQTTRNPNVQPTVNPATAPITDTYDNPEQALRAVRHALLVASIHLNEGQKQIVNK